MRKAKLVAFITLAAVMLYGCKKNEETVESQSTEVSEASEEVSEETSEVAEEPEDEIPEGMVVSTLSGECIDESLENQRPIAVMLNNVKAAVPQTGIKYADVVYEAPVEGNITRLMGIIKDWHDLEKIGSVRSCRDYFVYWALEWDSIYCHFGGPVAYVTTILERADVDNLDGTKLDGTVYFRSSDRKAPHNAYASGEGILEGIELNDFETEYTSNYTGDHFLFADVDERVELTDGIDATHVEPGYLVNKPWFDYNEEDGLYYRYQYGGEHIDDEDGSQLAYTNILLQNTYYEVRDAKGYLAFQDVDDTRTGWYITGGKAIQVMWRKKSDYEPTIYYDMSGQEITLNPGKTWICIIEEGSEDNVVIE